MFALGLATLSLGVLSVWSAVKGVKVIDVATAVLSGAEGGRSIGTASASRNGGASPSATPDWEAAVGIPVPR